MLFFQNINVEHHFDWKSALVKALWSRLNEGALKVEAEELIQLPDRLEA